MGIFDWKHWIVLLVVVVLVFGTKKLKNLGSDLGDPGAHGPGADHANARSGVQYGHGSASLEARGAFFYKGADALTVVLTAPGQALQVFFQL